MRRPFRTQWFSAHAIRLANILLTLTTGGCVASQVPLTTPAKGFVDRALVGYWLKVDRDGLDKTPSVHVDVDAYGMMTIELLGGKDSDCDTAYLLAAYSSRLAGKKYLNARFVGCKGQPPYSAPPEDPCTYIIMRYAVDNDLRSMRRELGEASLTELQSLSEPFPGRLAALNLGDEGPAISAIMEGRIDGVPKGHPPCLTAAAGDLRRFVRQGDKKIYPARQWQFYVRVDTATAD